MEEEKKTEEKKTKSKKYFWIKIQDKFFSDIAMKKMRKQNNGAVFLLIYLKMMAYACKQEGIIYYQGVYDTLAEEIAEDISESDSDVFEALSYFEKNNLIQYQDQNCFIPETLTLVGKEGESASRTRDWRLRQEQSEHTTSQSDGKTSQCDNDVTTCDTEKEKETNTETYIEKDSNLKSDSDLNSDSEIHEDSSNNEMYQSNGIKLNRYGKYNNIYLPSIRYDLLARNYSAKIRDQVIEKMSEFLFKKNQTYQDYYAKIKEWIEKDYTKEMIECEKQNIQSYPLEYDLAQYYDESKPPYYGFPEEFFTDGVFDETRVRPILQKSTDSLRRKGRYDEHIISVDEIKHNMKLILNVRKMYQDMIDSETVFIIIHSNSCYLLE